MGFKQTQESKFYYAYNEKIYLHEVNNKLIVRYKKNKKTEKKQVSSYLGLGEESINWKDDSTCVVVIKPSEISKVRDEILKQADVKTLNPVYAINTGMEMGVTDEILVKFNENVSQKEIAKLHEKYGVVVEKITDLYQLLKVPNGADAMEIANEYQKTGLTRFSHPNFISEVELHQSIPNDTYFPNQFSLHNTGQVFTDGHSGTFDADIDTPEAWAITQGNNNIVIAVLDQGVSDNHPDLPNARQIRLNGSNFADGNPNDPSPTGSGNHGNGCAGIIGATQNNNEGIAGIAPNCRIMPIRIFNADDSGITPQRLADAITFARQNGADIISNSWGYDSDNPNLYPVIRDAIIAATTQGRNNLGCVVVFSAGNNFINNGKVHFPSNVNVAGVLTVGASDRYDKKSYYSPLSDPSSSNNQLIDLVAPSHRAYSNQITTETFEAWSIDIPGTPGYNPVKATDGGTLPVVGSISPDTGLNNQSYTGRFGGTSYSCPQVAGVAALLLSVNSNLTQQQVFNILTSTTDKVGGYAYTNGFSNELGYGRINASKAVLKTLNLSIIGSPNVCATANNTYTIQNYINGINTVWASTPNLTLTNQTNNSVSVIANDSSFSGEGTITATFQNGLTVTKTIWVGKPSLPTFLKGPTTVNTGALVNYNGGTSQGATSYEWWLPYPYDTVNTFDYFGQNWQKLTDYSDSNSIQAFTGYAQNSGLVQFMGKNACGCGGAKSIQVSHGSGGGGQIPRMANPEGTAWYTIYPNPSSDFVNIELRDQNRQPITSSKIIAELYDLMGHKKAKVEIRNNIASINVRGLQKGIYILNINIDGQIEGHQVIVE